MRPGGVERFCTHVLEGPDPGSCWLWSGAISDDGYGRFWIGTAAGQWAVAAHRFVLATVPGGLGAIEGSIALHWCDVPLCVHPTLEPTTHLLLGTASENMADPGCWRAGPPIPCCSGTTMPWSHAVVSCAAEAVSAPVPRAGSWTRTAAHRCGEQGRSGASGWAAVRLGS